MQVHHNESTTVSGRVEHVFAHRFAVKTAEAFIPADLTAHSMFSRRSAPMSSSKANKNHRKSALKPLRSGRVPMCWRRRNRSMGADLGVDLVWFTPVWTIATDPIMDNGICTGTMDQNPLTSHQR